MGPLVTLGLLDKGFELLLAILIGMAFGFILEQAGFSSSRKLVGLFYGYDFVVLKVFFTGALVAMIGLIFFNYFEWIELDRIFVNTFYVGPTLIGAAIMGFGFIVGGFCPGTSACAASIGKIDAMVFFGGLFIGIMIFGFGFPLWGDFYTSGNQGKVLIHEVLGVSRGVFLFGLTIVTLVLFWGSVRVQRKHANKNLKY